MNIFITGATGYVGNNLAKRLAGEGHTIHALSRSANKNFLLDHPNIKIFPGDITEIASVEKAMQDCRQVYHLAAYARVWAKDPSVFYKLNVEGTKHVLEAAKKLALNDIVFTSTGGVLGPSNGKPVKEDDKKPQKEEPVKSEPVKIGEPEKDTVKKKNIFQRIFGKKKKGE